MIVINPLATSLPLSSFPLIQLPTGSSGLLGATFDFASTGTTSETLALTGGVYNLSLANSATAESLTIVPAAPTWQPTAGGAYNWSTPATNWSYSVPNSQSAVANIGGIPTANSQTITVDQSTITVGSLTFDNFLGGVYTIGPSGGNMLALDNGGATATAKLVNRTNNNIISAPVQLGSIVTADVAAGTSLTLSGPLTGSTPLNVNPDSGNTGALIVSANNTGLSSPIAISAGTLNFASGSLGSGTITFAGNSTLQYASGNTQDVSPKIQAIPGGVTATIDTNVNNVTFATPLTGSGGLAKAGAGTLTFSGANTYTGATTISAGALQLGDGVSNNGSVAGNITNNAALVFANVSPQVYAGVISGAGSVSVNGTSTVSLTGTNTYLGATTVNSSTLQVGDPLIVQNPGFTAPSETGTSQTYSSMTTAQKAALVWTTTSNFSVGGNGSSVGITGSSSGQAAVLQGAQEFQQSINFPRAGQYVVTFDDEYFGTAGTITVALGSTQLGVFTPNNDNLYGDTNPAFNNSTQGDVNGNPAIGAFTVAAAGPQTLSFTGSSSGTDFVTNVAIFQVGQLPSTTALSVAAGSTFDLAGNQQTVAGLTGSGTVTNSIVDSTSNFTVAPPVGTKDIFNGVLQAGAGQLGLVVGLATFSASQGVEAVPGGTLILTGASGANQNSGPPYLWPVAIFVNSGTLVLAGGASLGHTTAGVSGTFIIDTTAAVPMTFDLYMGSLDLGHSNGYNANGSVYYGVDSAVTGTISVGTDQNFIIAYGKGTSHGPSSSATAYLDGGTMIMGAPTPMLDNVYLPVAQVGVFANGTLDMSGGTLEFANSGGVFNMSPNEGASTEVGALNMNGGSILTQAGTFSAGQVINASGGAGADIINLNGGLLETAAWTSSSLTTLNFNGGTLEAGAASTAFLGGTGGVKIYAGGANINTNGLAVTIVPVIANPSATSGLASISVTATSDVFTTPPTVNISGGAGTGATCRNAPC